MDTLLSLDILKDIIVFYKITSQLYKNSIYVILSIIVLLEKVIFSERLVLI